MRSMSAWCRGYSNSTVLLALSTSSRSPDRATDACAGGVVATRVRFGDRRLTVLVRRNGWPVNATQVYRPDT
ncbi:MAG: hypothetical protein LZF86_190656 [Nitrospira sp.]|nr:MAG: hypothetical protein LZF86_190656 [Nitrospira sp.]